MSQHLGAKKISPLHWQHTRAPLTARFVRLHQ